MADETTVDLNEYNGGSLVVACTALLIMTWFAVGLRSYTRLFLMKSYQADDWLMLIAQLIFTVTCAFVLEGVRRGLGKHNAAVADEDDRVAALMWQALTIAIYILDMMFIKLSIGVFLLRMATRGRYIWVIRASVVIVALWSLGIFIWDVFQCTPVAKQWDFRITTGHCAGPNEIISAAYALSVMTVLSDWFFALIPIPMLWGVKMTKQAKATVIVILGLGVFASIATLVRLKFLSGLEMSDDLLFSVTDATIWSLVEPGVAIIASSLATIRPLLRALKIRGFLSTDKYPGSGISGTARYAHGSRNTRGSMPGYGPHDLSLHSVPNKNDTYPGHVSISIDESHGQIQKSSQDSGDASSDAKSETFIMTDTSHSPMSRSHDPRRTDRPMDKPGDLESHGREYQLRKGWGVE
ncbi:integral membrane family protein [Metarhizium album ARSEF 1941]|uniref:Integral membrane family protein n=1 Tax=Metarhizium album (strain ARSEF 1941) TaxID=1081103 RepID=A0A0B2WM74_METAS|nr:integral membrane family protein [Metarhizium album ARSEF 1941]KHN94597.1 integral membrane family protein [Metarhizium album ARSEF 1941]